MGREPPDIGYTMCDPGTLLIGQTLTEAAYMVGKVVNRI